MDLGTLLDVLRPLVLILALAGCGNPPSPNVVVDDEPFLSLDGT